MSEQVTEAQEIYRSRWVVCDDCGCSTVIENRDDPAGVPDENDWHEFPRCLVCGSSQMHWNADGTTVDDAYWAKGQLAMREVIAARCQTWATERFDEHGPEDARGAALWDVAAWLREEGGSPNQDRR